MRSHFFWKLYAGYVGLILLATVAVGVLVARQVEALSLEEVRRSLEARTVLLQEIARGSLTGSPEPELQRRVEALGQEIETRLTVIAADGVVIADSDEPPSRMDNHGQRPEILNARDAGRGSATRFSRTMNMEMLYHALPVRDGGRVSGYVRASLPVRDLGKRLAAVRASVAAGAGAAALVALLLGLWVARWLSRPLTSMTRIAESMAAGDYGQRLDLHRHDEIGQLAEALNRLAASGRQRLDALITERNQILAILSSMAEGVIAVDREEQVVHLNRVAGDILRIPGGEWMGKRLWEVTRVREASEVLTEILKGAPRVARETRLLTGKHEKRIQLQAAPLRDAAENTVGAVLVLHDITELRRLETVRSDFVANVSHELKTPVAAIQALVETLIDDQEMERATHDGFLERIRNQCGRLTTILRDLLLLSRAESAASRTKQPNPVDIRRPALASAQEVTALGRKKGVAVDTEVPETPLAVLMDEESVRHMVGNLLENALKYTREGGHVWMRLRREDGHAVLEVQDDGIGIEPEHHQRIFERFYRVDKGRSRDMGGTGLGLSIVKNITLAHGGRIAVESTPGTGSTFRVSLPLAG